MPSSVVSRPESSTKAHKVEMKSPSSIAEAVSLESTRDSVSIAEEVVLERTLNHNIPSNARNFSEFRAVNVHLKEVHFMHGPQCSLSNISIMDTSEGQVEREKRTTISSHIFKSTIQKRRKASLDSSEKQVQVWR